MTFGVGKLGNDFSAWYIPIFIEIILGEIFVNFENFDEICYGVANR